MTSKGKRDANARWGISGDGSSRGWVVQDFAGENGKQLQGVLARAQRRMTIACLTLSDSRPPLPAYTAAVHGSQQGISTIVSP